MAEQLTVAQVAQLNNQFLGNALKRTYTMQQTAFTGPSQLKEIEVDAVPGWAHAIDLNFEFNVNIASTTLPTLSQFAPWNIIGNLQVSLGGGPFQNYSPYFLYIRESLSRFGWQPDKSATNFAYAAQVLYNIPSVQNGVQKWKFTIRLPLQVQPGSAMGLIPLGSSSTKMKIRLTTATAFNGTDAYLNPLVGGTGVTVTLDTATTSFVTPVIHYYTAPATRGDVPTPIIGSVLNVQERATAFIGSSLTPIKFPDPFRYLRLYHIIIDGTGQPTSTALERLELDLTPGYPQYQFSDQAALASYFYGIREQYGLDLPPGVFVFDLFAGSDNWNPNGTQTIDGTVFQTLQTQVAVKSGTNTASPARIITFAEALSPVNF